MRRDPEGGKRPQRRRLDSGFSVMRMVFLRSMKAGDNQSDGSVSHSVQYNICTSCDPVSLHLLNKFPLVQQHHSQDYHLKPLIMTSTSTGTVTAMATVSTYCVSRHDVNECSPLQTTNTSVPKAAPKVFAIPELLEHILSSPNRSTSSSSSPSTVLSKASSQTHRDSASSCSEMIQ